MASLEEIAAKNKRLGMPEGTNALGRMAERLNRAAWWAPSQIAAIPTKGAKNVLEGMLFGPKNINPASPAFGKRMNAAGEVGNRQFSQITKAEFDAISAGEKPGRAVSKRVSPAQTAYFKQKFRPGGIAGWAGKNPLLAGGAGLLAYYLATSPGARQASGQMAGGMVPGLDVAPTAATQKQWAQPSFENPLAKDVWGK